MSGNQLLFWLVILHMVQLMESSFETMPFSGSNTSATNMDDSSKGKYVRLIRRSLSPQNPSPYLVKPGLVFVILVVFWSFLICFFMVDFDCLVDVNICLASKWASYLVILLLLYYSKSLIYCFPFLFFKEISRIRSKKRSSRSTVLKLGFFIAEAAQSTWVLLDKIVEGVF